MKYYSELLNKIYDDEKTLIQAELEHTEALEAEKAALNEKAARKKELAKNVEAADAAVDAAYKVYEEAKAQCQTIIEEGNKTIAEIMKEAKAHLDSAQKARLAAVSEFNKEFGPFKTQYTGDRAQREYTRVQSLVDDIFNNTLKFFW